MGLKTLKLTNVMIEWFNALICDHGKSAFVSVISFFSGITLHITDNILEITGPLINPFLEHFITILLMWCSFGFGSAISIIAIYTKTKHWYYRKFKLKIK